MNAKAFLDTIKDAGYKGINYSSKRYLETVWYPLEYDTWLAHYTKQTTYKGKYKYWQLTSTGRIDGIKGYVDIDIMYE
jgi:GH25 family lysozyme M1 (1,4-beta-N-acetylmuramidase)